MEANAHTHGGVVYSKDNAPFDEEKANGHVAVTTHAIPEHQIQHKSPVFRWVSKLFAMGVEARGIERVPEDERSNKHVWNVMIMWWSVNTVATTVPIGCLAQFYFFLDLPHAIGLIVGFSAIGAATVGFIASLGPQTGLRTMVISRYSAGWIGGSIFSILNILTQLGFSVTAVILGGQTLANISGKLPLVVGVIIVAVCSLLVCFWGYSALHHYEKYAWIFITAIFIMMYSLGGKAGYQPELQVADEDTGRDYIADCLSFGGIIFSSAAGWAPVAADFNVRLPADISPAKVFWMTWFGLMIPLIFAESLGVALMTVPAYAAAYDDGEIGGLFAEVFSVWGGGGDFLLVVLAFSVVANNIPNTYSAALSIQALHPILEKVPRAIWTFVVFAAYTLAGVFGREHFSAILSNFLAVLGYWIAFFIAILAAEHFIFKRTMLPGYDLTAYNRFSALPIGVAAIFAMACGVAGAVVGMAETWYIGPIAAMLGPYGGDLGFELSFGFSLIAYLPARYLEIKLVGR